MSDPNKNVVLAPDIRTSDKKILTKIIRLWSQPSFSLKSKVVIWLGLILSVPSIAGIWAVSHLTYLPAIPNCEQEFTSSDDLASRLYCAKTLADSQEAAKLLNAIRLANTIPTNHPLRAESDRLIAQWSGSVLHLAEMEFQNGKLDSAKNIIIWIPKDITARQQGDKKIKQWESTWTKAENIYKTALAQLENNDRGKWYSASRLAKELLHLNNDYWTTTKYPELIRLIQENREIAEKESQPQENCTPSPNCVGTNSIATDTPTQLQSQGDRSQQIKDQALLKKARALASSGKMEDLLEAIAQAYQVNSSPNYLEAQKLIAEWNRQIDIAQDSSSLARAKELAKEDTVISLEAAIFEARSIMRGRTLYKEANNYIKQWDRRISVLEAQNKVLTSNKNTNDGANWIVLDVENKQEAFQF